MKYLFVRLLIIPSVFLSLQTRAQQKTVSGTVVDEKGQPLPGVNIVVVRTHRGASTDFDGRFSILADKGENLKFSYIGYTAVVKPIGTNDVINVQMQPTAKRLQEVVMTGYTRSLLSDYVGAASVISPQAIEKIPNVSIAQKLQGFVPGLLIMSASGQPGHIPNIWIRGLHSIADQHAPPLLVVNGSPVPIELFNTLNTDDIENISVLKDAASLAPYGMRGTNGAIVITTKSGKGKQLITFRSEFGWSELGTQKFDVMNSSQILAFQKLVGLGPGYTYRDDEQKLQALRDIHTDWKKVFFRRGTRKKYSFITAFGNEKTQSRFSLGWSRQDGVSLASSYREVPFSAHIQHRINRFLNTGVDLSLTYNKTESVRFEGVTSYLNNFAAVYYGLPYQRLYRSDGQLDIGPGKLAAGSYDNILNGERRNDKHMVGFGSAHLKVDLRDDLYFRVRGTISHRGADEHDWINPNSFLASGTTYKKGLISYARYRHTELQSQTELCFDKQIGAAHRVRLSAFTEYLYGNTKSEGFTGYGLSAKLPESYAAITPGSREKGFIPVVNGGEVEDKLFSYFVLGDYSWKGKYKFSASFRRDNSSRLPRHNRWASLWSAEALWKIKDENFLSAAQWIDDLALRGSYGITSSNAAITQYAYQDTYVTARYKGLQALGVGDVGNPNLRWELSHRANIGLNFGFFHRVYGELDIYRDRISNLYIKWLLSQTSGFFKIKDNQGEMINKGLELQLDADLIRNRNLSWSIYGNVAYNKNEVTDLGQVKEFEYSTTIVREGLPLDSHYLVGWAGVDPKDGAPLYYDKEGHKTKQYKPEYRVAKWGTSIPPTTGGFGTHLDLTNGLYLHAHFSFALDYYRYSNRRFVLENPRNAALINLDGKMLKIWQKPGDKTDIQGHQYDLKHSSKFLEDASFVRFRTLTLGWKTPDALTRSLGLRGLELYGSVQNPFTWTGWTGFDPEGINTGTFNYPTPRIFSIGCRISF